MESVLRLQRADSFFGRLEQMGSDELWRDNQSSQGGAFKLNKLTLGYAHDARFNGSLQVDVGGLLSKPFAPADMNALRGSNSLSLMMFLRLKLQ